MDPTFGLTTEQKHKAPICFEMSSFEPHHNTSIHSVKLGRIMFSFEMDSTNDKLVQLHY